MKPLIPVKGATPLFFILVALLYFAILPQAQAVIPPPDGGYPGGNTAEGQAALLNLTTGAFNTAVGYLALESDTTGSLNTAVGAATLVANTADQNTAAGAGALVSNTTGGKNTANGALALYYNTTGGFNTANGVQALFSNTTGNNNTADGYRALYSNTIGSANTAIGDAALFFNTASQNTATGYQALMSNTTGTQNAAYGFAALHNNSAASYNTAIGYQALFTNSEGAGNTAVGVGALYLSGGFGGVGYNTAVGAGALGNLTAGAFNIAVGNNAGSGVTAAAHVICIGAAGANVSDSCYIGNIFGETSASGAAVYVNSNHKLGTLTSSSRFKDDIKPMERVSEALFALKPVTFHYKKEIDPAGMQQFGLVAEDVEKINPDLVVRDKEGKPYSVRYEQVNAMLLNEFLKEHRKNEEQEATITRLQKQVQALTASLQKVSAQVERSRLAPQMVVNEQ
jgi:hypothetical protein